MKNKEIEELLNDMRYSYEIHEEIIKKYNNADKIHYPYTISLKQINLLLSYIEQLEEELKQEKKDYKETNDKCFELISENKQLENNRDKAIEFIEEKRKVFEWYDIDLFYLESLLKGDSDEFRRN